MVKYSKKEIQKFLNQEKILKPYKEWLSLHDPKVLDIDCNEYYDNFWADDAPSGYEVYLKHQDNWNINKTKWKKKGSGKLQCQVSTMVPLSGIPFVSETSCQKVVEIKLRTENKLILEINS